MGVLKMDSIEVRKRRNSKTYHVATMPERIRIDEPARLGGRCHRVRTGNPIAPRLKLIKGEIQPATFCVPVGNGRHRTLLENLLRDYRVVRQLHLIDGH